MRTYELMVIFRPTLDEKTVATEVEKVAELIQSNGGSVVKTKVWGRRKLAYAIDDQLEGSYVLFYLELAPASLQNVEFNLKLDENVLRYMVVKSEGVAETPEVVEEAPAAEVETATDEAAAPVSEEEVAE